MNNDLDKLLKKLDHNEEEKRKFANEFIEQCNDDMLLFIIMIMLVFAFSGLNVNKIHKEE